MKLKTKIWLLTSTIIALITGVDYLVGQRAVQASVREELAINAREIRAILMSMRRVYHEQFIASGLPVDDRTIGFLPAHALSRISADFPNWAKSDLSFNNVSDRPRNPANRADKHELEAMAWFRANPEATERMVDIRGDDGRRYYHFTAPIWMEPYCIRCHGKPEDAPASISKNYQEAFGYKVGDLRGVMSIKLPMDPLETHETEMWIGQFSVRLVGYSLLLVFLGAFLNRVVVSRLARLEGAAGRLASGNYVQPARLPGDEDRDEVGTLANAFDRMAEAIRERDLALKETEERFRMATERMRDGFVLIRGEKGEVVWWNRAAEAIFGYAREEILGKPIHEFIVPPAQRNAIIDTGLARFSREGYGPIIGRTLELRAQHKDGHEFDVEVSLAAVRLQDAWHAVGVVRDVTERKQAEAELLHYRVHLEDLVAQRTAELNSLFEALPDVYFRLKGDGTVLDARSGHDTEFYLVPGAALGKRIQDILPPEVGAKFETALGGLDAGQGTTVIECDLPTASGQQYYEARLLPFGDGEVISVIRNITARKSMEAARESARREAERLAHVKSEFLANMSHEIRTPLNGVMGLAQIGYRDSPEGSKARETFGRIVESGNLLLGIINDILDFSKIEAGKVRLERIPVDLGKVIGGAVELLSEQARAKGIDIRVEMSPDLPAFCLGDPLRLTQILVNLLSNAVKFTAQGHITASAGREGDVLVLRVSDTGIGIAPELIGRLFVPFEQADGSTTRRFGGTGLGLPITGRLVEMMGGVIVTTSRPGEGSSFEIRLPLVEADAPPAGDMGGAALAAGVRRLVGIRILAAEDNEVNRLVLEDMLAFEGAEVVSVQNGRLAVERVLAEGKDAFDIVLMDVQMPEMDGYEATRRILEIAPGLPVIGQTAHALLEEHDKCIASGMAGVLVKPLQEARLVEEVLRHVRRAAHPAAPAAGEASPPVSPVAGPASAVAETWIDWAALRTRYGRKPGFVNKLLDVSLSSHAGTAEKLRQAAREGNMAQMAYLSHSIKGMAGTILANGLMEQAKAAEMAARAGAADAGPRAVRLAESIESLLREIESRTKT